MRRDNSTARTAGETSRHSSDVGVVSTLGDIILVGVAVLAAVLIITLVLEITGVLSEGDPVAVFEFTYEGNISAEYADSFGTTNTDGSYDGLLTLTHAHGSAVPATMLYINGTSSQSGMVSWANSVDGTDGPSYDDDDTVGASSDLEVWVRTDDTVIVIWNEAGENPVRVGTWEHSDQ
jgi:hypothetical protein